MSFTRGYKSKEERLNAFWAFMEERDELWELYESGNTVQKEDKHEKEADDVAKKVTTGNEINADTLTPVVTQPQAKAEGEGEAKIENNTVNQLEASKGGGQPLEDSVKGEMEEKMNTDLSGVRIHTGNNSNKINEEANAKAITYGQDVHFKEGNYNTNTPEGKELLAHELTHTQQQGMGGKKVQRQEDEKKGKEKTKDENIQGEEDEPIEKGYQIPVLMTRDIPFGDPEHYAMRLFISQVLELPENNYRVERAISKFRWKWEFPFSLAGQVQYIFMSNTTFIRAINYAYEEEGLRTLYKLTNWLYTIQEPIDSNIRTILLELAKEYALLTQVDALYFNKWVDEKYSSIKGVKIDDLFMSEVALTTHLSLIKTFNMLKLSLLSKNDMLKEFTTHSYGDGNPDDRVAKIENLKDRINSIPAYLITEFTDETGVGFWDATKSYFKGGGVLPLVMEQTVSDELARLGEIDKKLAEKGFAISELFQFRELFQELAIGEAFKMLKQGYDVLKQEEKRYDDPENVKELYNYLQENYTPRFRAADFLRAQATRKFLETHDDVNRLSLSAFLFAQTGTPWQTYLVTIQDIYSDLKRRKNNTEALAERIADISPYELILTLSAVKNYLEGHLAQNQTLSVTGETGFQRAYKEMLSSDDRFIKADKMDMETVHDITTVGAQKYPILYDISINFRGLSGYGLKGFGREIRKQIKEKKKNNEDITKQLKEDPELVWKFELLIEKVRNDYGISADSPPGKLITDILDDINAAEFWKNIGLAVLGIGLGIAGFFTGGATWAGLALIGGGLAIGAYDIYVNYQEYKFKEAATDTALDAASELSADTPSLLGLVLSVVGFMFDAGAIVKFMKAAKAFKGATITDETVTVGGYTAKNVEDLQESFDDFTKAVLNNEGIEVSAKRIYETLGKGRLKGNPTLEQFTDGLKDIVKKDKQLQNYTTEIDDFIRYAGIDAIIAKELQEGVLGIGLRRLYDLDKEGTKALLALFKNNPKVLFQLLDETVMDENFAGTLTKLSKMLRNTDNWLASDNFENVMVYLSNNRRTGLSDLNEVVTSIDNALIKDPDLIAQIIMNYKLKVAFRNMDNPAELTDLWKAFKDENPPSSFTEYVNSKVDFKKVQTIESKYPGLSTKLPYERGLTLLGDTEKKLMEAIQNGTLLPDNTKLNKALKTLLDKDELSKITAGSNLDYARSKVISAVNKIIGKHLNNVDELKEVMKLVQQPGSRGSIAEYYAFTKKLLGGTGDDIKKSLSIDVSNLGLKNPSKFNPDELVFNSGTGKFGEIKSGYQTGAVDLDQVDNYITIFQNRSNPKFAEMFKNLGIEGDNFKGVDYLIMPGQTGDTYTAAMKVYYKILESEGAEALLNEGHIMVKYLDSDNVVKIFNP